MTAKKATLSPPAANVPYYTPAQDPPAGTATATETGAAGVPTLFTPLKIRGVTLSNRFAVSPMCMYSADDGHLTDFHLVHLGSFAMRGTALTIVEATSVTPNGRISPEDSGIWKDSQIAPLRRVTDFIHSQGQHAAIQLAHAGRKASTIAPWHASKGKANLAGADIGGWPENIWGPSAIPFAEGYGSPKEMTVQEIEGLVQSFIDGAKRAVAAGFDVIEIHGAHGYLITEFLSPISNKRTDAYGGSFENRARLLLDVVKAVRATVPESMPIFVRISATEWMEWAGHESWDLPQSIRLAKLLSDLGVDLLDVSSGGNSYEQKIDIHPYYQVSLAGQIRAALQAEGKSMLIGAVGMITNAEMARSIVQDGKLVANGTSNGISNGTMEISEEHGQTTQADMVLLARQYLREPEFVLRTAHHLGVDVKWPIQYHRAHWRKDTKI